MAGGGRGPGLLSFTHPPLLESERPREEPGLRLEQLWYPPPSPYRRLGELLEEEDDLGGSGKELLGPH